MAGELGDHSQILIAPHGALHTLPFEALFIEEIASAEDYPGFSALPFLIHEGDVSYAPSGTFLRQSRRGRRGSREETQRGVLLVGDPARKPESDGTVFFRAATSRSPGPLPHARREIEGVKRINGGASVTLLTGAKATRGNLEEALGGRTFDVIHFATHGVFNAARPRFSGILLAPDPAGVSGFLDLETIFGLQLDCELVVLSACSSALGEHIRGEGLVGLTRAFLYAGARAVVASLWSVSGRATADLMVDFSRARESGLASGPASALARAKRDRLAAAAGKSSAPARLREAHPYFWSPFICIAGAGNGSGGSHADR
ncbi:MAG: CHAT domain-containing protein [Candidatus Eisenbacteria bacterium]|nr:CHAT domain-containing protein [Candidatus Eisenbacteria bacterium]